MLNIVLPKGSLERATLELFNDADLSVTRSSDVDYRATIDDPRVNDVRILRPQEIPRYVAEGRFDLGITGRDWIEETEAEVVSLTELHYSKATARPIRVVLAVEASSPAQSVADLPPGLRVSPSTRSSRGATSNATASLRTSNSRTALLKPRSPTSPTRSSRSPRRAVPCAPRVFASSTRSSRRTPS